MSQIDMDAGLVRRLEVAEREAWRSIFEAAPPEFAKGVGVQAERQGEALLTLTARIDTNQFNRLQGLGIDAPAADERIAAAVRRFGDAGLQRFFVQIAPGPGQAAAEAQ